MCGPAHFVFGDMTTQQLARCRWCGLTWAIQVRAVTPAAAAVTRANQGDRCPFCQSSKVILLTERESQQTPT